MGKFLSKLKQQECEIRSVIGERLSEKLLSASRQRAIVVTILAVVLFLSTIILLLRKMSNMTIQRFAEGVAEGSKCLRKEEEKCDDLLFQIFPPSVIRHLKQHRQVPVEKFHSVTIYFSDIVGFTNVSANSTPLEVVNMLDSLYKLFDATIRKYDVYKVETIGDSYMVVSGLPRKNENRHAGEIATMSLDLLAKMSSFVIPHRPDERLAIRIGVNTGPCVAGVVGTTMPRYSLFGDTINTASRMESTGKSMMIHISQSTKALLDEEGGYKIDLRGSTKVKGKGEMMTYWLIDKHQHEFDNEVMDEQLITPGSVTAPECLQLLDDATKTLLLD